MENYSQLKTYVKSWLARTDLTDAELDNFISVATSRINRLLRIGGMETTTTLSINSQTVALPSDFRGARSLYLQTSDYADLRYMTPDQMNNKLRSGTGRPGFFTIKGANIMVDIAPDQTYSATLDYFAKFDVLDDSNTTNWLTDNAPDVLLWGCLCAAGKYIRDPEVMATYKTYFDEAIDEVSQSDEMDRHGPAPVMRTESNYP